jgi:hypothetical protein
MSGTVFTLDKLKRQVAAAHVRRQRQAASAKAAAASAGGGAEKPETDPAAPHTAPDAVHTSSEAALVPLADALPPSTSTETAPLAASTAETTDQPPPPPPEYTPEQQNQIDELRREAVQKKKDRDEYRFKRRSTTTDASAFIATKPHKPGHSFSIPSKHQGVATFFVVGPENADFYYPAFGIVWCHVFKTEAAGRRQYKKWLTPSTKGKHKGKRLWASPNNDPYPVPRFVDLDTDLIVGTRATPYHIVSALKGQIAALSATESPTEKQTQELETAQAQLAKVRQLDQKVFDAALERVQAKRRMGAELFDKYMDEEGLWINDGPDGPQAEFTDDVLDSLAQEHSQLEKEAEESAQNEFVFPKKCKPKKFTWLCTSFFCDPADNGTFKQNWFFRPFGAETSREWADAFVHDKLMPDRKGRGVIIPMKMAIGIPMDITNSARFHDTKYVDQIHGTQDQQDMADYYKINEERRKKLDAEYEAAGFKPNVTPFDPEYEPSKAELQTARALAASKWADRPDRTPARIALQAETKAGDDGGGGTKSSATTTTTTTTNSPQS